MGLRLQFQLFFDDVSDRNKVYVRNNSEVYSSLYHHINHQYDPTQNSEFLSDDEVDVQNDMKLWYTNLSANVEDEKNRLQIFFLQQKMKNMKRKSTTMR